MSKTESRRIGVQRNVVEALKTGRPLAPKTGEIREGKGLRRINMGDTASTEVKEMEQMRKWSSRQELHNEFWQKAGNKRISEAEEK